MQDPGPDVARVLPLSLFGTRHYKEWTLVRKGNCIHSELPMSSNWTMFLENTSILKMECKDNAENDHGTSCGEILVVIVGKSNQTATHPERPPPPCECMSFRVRTLFDSVCHEDKSLFLLLRSSLLDM